MWTNMEWWILATGSVILLGIEFCVFSICRKLDEIHSLLSSIEYTLDNHFEENEDD